MGGAARSCPARPTSTISRQSRSWQTTGHAAAALLARCLTGDLDLSRDRRRSDRDLGRRLEAARSRRGRQLRLVCPACRARMVGRRRCRRCAVDRTAARGGTVADRGRCVGARLWLDRGRGHAACRRRGAPPICNWSGRHDAASSTSSPAWRWAHAGQAPRTSRCRRDLRRPSAACGIPSRPTAAGEPVDAAPAPGLRRSNPIASGERNAARTRRDVLPSDVTARRIAQIGRGDSPRRRRRLEHPGRAAMAPLPQNAAASAASRPASHRMTWPRSHRRSRRPVSRAEPWTAAIGSRSSAQALPAVAARAAIARRHRPAPLSDAAMAGRVSPRPGAAPIVHVTIDRHRRARAAVAEPAAEAARRARPQPAVSLSDYLRDGARRRGDEFAARHRRRQRGAAQSARQRSRRGRRGDGQRPSTSARWRPT